MNRSIHSITAKLIKYSLSFSLNLYLRLMETKYNEGMNYASWRLAFCFSKHKYAIHKSKAAYLRQIREIADKGKPYGETCGESKTNVYAE